MDSVTALVRQSVLWRAMGRKGLFWGSMLVAGLVQFLFRNVIASAGGAHAWSHMAVALVVPALVGAFLIHRLRTPGQGEYWRNVARACAVVLAMLLAFSLVAVALPQNAAFQYLLYATTFAALLLRGLRGLHRAHARALKRAKPSTTDHWRVAVAAGVLLALPEVALTDGVAALDAAWWPLAGFLLSLYSTLVFTAIFLLFPDRQAGCCGA